MSQPYFSNVEQSTITVVDGKLSDIENFDDLSLEHWVCFNDKKPIFNIGYLGTLRVVIAKDDAVVGRSDCLDLCRQHHWPAFDHTHAIGRFSDAIVIGQVESLQCSPCAVLHDEASLTIGQIFASNIS